MDRERARQIIRAEVSKYINRQFSDTQDFTRDLLISSDDLTAIALTIEKLLGIQADRKRYRTVHNVEEYTNLVCELA